MPRNARMSTASSKTRVLMFKHDRRWVRQPTKRERKFINEVRRLAKMEMLLKRAPLVRMLRDIKEESLRPDQRFSAYSIEALRAAAQNYLDKLFKCAEMVVAHRGRDTLKVEDLTFVRALWERRPTTRD